MTTEHNASGSQYSLSSLGWKVEDDTSPDKTSGNFWSTSVGGRNVTRALISIIFSPEVFSKLRDKTTFKKKIYMDIAETLTEQGFVLPWELTLAGDKINQKYRNLVNLYYRHVEKMKQGLNVKRPRYFDELHPHLSKIEPVTRPKYPEVESKFVTKETPIQVINHSLNATGSIPTHINASKVISASPVTNRVSLEIPNPLPKVLVFKLEGGDSQNSSVPSQSRVQVLPVQNSYLSSPTKVSNVSLPSQPRVIIHAQNDAHDTSSDTVSDTFWDSTVGKQTATEALIAIVFSPEVQAQLKDKTSVKRKVYEDVGDELKRRGFLVPWRRTLAREKVSLKYRHLKLTYKKYVEKLKEAETTGTVLKRPKYMDLLHPHLSVYYGEKYMAMLEAMQTTTETIETSSDPPAHLPPPHHPPPPSEGGEEEETLVEECNVVEEEALIETEIVDYPMPDEAVEYVEDTSSSEESKHLKFWKSVVGDQDCTEAMLSIIFSPEFYYRITDRSIVRKKVFESVADRLESIGFVSPWSRRTTGFKIYLKYNYIVKSYRSYVKEANVTGIVPAKCPKYFEIVHEHMSRMDEDLDEEDSGDPTSATFWDTTAPGTDETALEATLSLLFSPDYSSRLAQVNSGPKHERRRDIYADLGDSLRARGFSLPWAERWTAGARIQAKVRAMLGEYRRRQGKAREEGREPMAAYEGVMEAGEGAMEIELGGDDGDRGSREMELLHRYIAEQDYVFPELLEDSDHTSFWHSTVPGGGAGPDATEALISIVFSPPIQRLFHDRSTGRKAVFETVADHLKSRGFELPWSKRSVAGDKVNQKFRNLKMVYRKHVEKEREARDTGKVVKCPKYIELLRPYMDNEVDKSADDHSFFASYSLPPDPPGIYSQQTESPVGYPVRTNPSGEGTPPGKLSATIGNPTQVPVWSTRLSFDGSGKLSSTNVTQRDNLLESSGSRQVPAWSAKLTFDASGKLSSSNLTEGIASGQISDWSTKLPINASSEAGVAFQLGQLFEQFKKEEAERRKIELREFRAACEMFRIVTEKASRQRQEFLDVMKTLADRLGKGGRKRRREESESE